MAARWHEIEQSLAGAVEVVPHGEDALRHFDFSVGGFWRSFTAAIIVLPAAIALYLSDYKLWAEEQSALPLPDLAPFLTLEIVGFCLRWGLFAVVMAVLCRQFNLSSRFVPFMVVFNWSSVLLAVLLLPPSMLYLLDIVSADVARILNFCAFFAAILYRVRIAEITLQIPATSAIAIPLIYVAINVSLKALTGAIHVAIAAG